MASWNWKHVAIAVAAGVVLIALYIYSRGGSIQGFQNPSDPTFTMYYADWCGHCKKAKPDYQDFMAKGPIEVNGKKCVIQMVSPEKEPEKARGKPIKGFPTFLLEMPDGRILEYRGERNTEGYLKFINESLGGNVQVQ